MQGRLPVPVRIAKAGPAERCEDRQQSFAERFVVVAQRGVRRGSGVQQGRGQRTCGSGPPHGAGRSSRSRPPRLRTVRVPAAWASVRSSSAAASCAIVLTAASSTASSVPILRAHMASSSMSTIRHIVRRTAGSVNFAKDEYAIGRTWRGSAERRLGARTTLRHRRRSAFGPDGLGPCSPARGAGKGRMTWSTRRYFDTTPEHRHRWRRWRASPACSPIAAGPPGVRSPASAGRAALPRRIAAELASPLPAAVSHLLVEVVELAFARHAGFLRCSYDSPAACSRGGATAR